MFVEHKSPGEVPSIREVEGPQLDEAGKVLLKAADVIEERGWCQHAKHSAGRLCVIGALDAVGAWHGGSEAWMRLERAMDGNCARWNDAPGRTKEEVVAKLRAVALGG